MNIDNEQCRSYLQLIEQNKKELLEKYIKYENCFQQLHVTALQHTTYKQYARGGACIHRGYYCPSPIDDIVIGNVNRGRLIKQPKESSKYDYYEYGFDKNNRMLYAKYRGIIAETGREIQRWEFIIYLNGISYSFLFFPFVDKMRLEHITKCIYDNDQIKEYNYAVFNIGIDGSDIECERLKIEQYHYNHLKLKKAVKVDASFEIPIVLWEYDEQAKQHKDVAITKKLGFNIFSNIKPNPFLSQNGLSYFDCSSYLFYYNQEEQMDYYEATDLLNQNEFKGRFNIPQNR